MKNYLVLIVILIQALLSSETYGQQSVLKGTVLDKENKSPLFAVNVLLTNQLDSSKHFASTDFDGHFTFNNLKLSTYKLSISYIGYDKSESVVKVDSDTLEIPSILISATSKILKEVEIKTKALTGVQKNDTTQFNSSSYKTNPDANAEDLINKLPGVTNTNGTVKVNGEEVKQVLVDGKTFFGDDASMALKNLPAEVIDKIQVFDKLSDQAQFTGFDDGQSNKTINIVTKQGKNNGQFGKLYAGYGPDNRYIAGGNLNLFKGQRRISLIGLSNNINQQNFNSQDLIGITGSSVGNRGSGGGGNRGGRGQGGNENFMTGQQNGISTTNAIGFNYSDNWGKKIKVQGSYFFNQTVNNINTNLTRKYITSRDSGLLYSELNNSESNNKNHRFNMKFEYQIDSANSITFTPKFNIQNNKLFTYLRGNNVTSENITESRTSNSTHSNNLAFNSSNNLLYRHKFFKKGRTFSTNFGYELNQKNGEGDLYALSEYIGQTSNSTTDQHWDLANKGYTLSTNISYTEPIDSVSQLQFSYSPRLTESTNNKETNNLDASGNYYSILDTLLSNKFESRYFANKGGVSYNFNNKKISFNFGIDYQNATLKGNQEFPYSYSVGKTFSSFLPQSMFNYKLKQGNNLRIMYRTNTNAPSVTQLQNVIDNKNPLLLSTGNSDLKQDYGHTLITRYGKTNGEKATGFFVFGMANYTMNYIGNSTLIALKDTFTNGITLKKGSQLTKPVNLNGYWNARSFLTYAFPVGWLKSNLNVNTGFTFNRIPGLINNSLNLANNYNLNQGVGISSNVSEMVDFNLSYNASYTVVKNSLRKESDNNYFNQTSSFKINYMPTKSWVLNTSLNHTLYKGLASSFNQDYLLWNASLAYKFLKDRSLEVKASVFDILNQNTNISRNITETYIEDSQSNSLNRYYLLTLTYSLKNFKSVERGNKTN